mmetsp:Transcript_2268/g.4767  ORF Transcript_2268/g.4767 Transcript_2268/m.4767 type:complete len:323 (+) Transcript_2268:2016-2984(+)
MLPSFVMQWKFRTSIVYYNTAYNIIQVVSDFLGRITPTAFVLLRAGLLSLGTHAARTVLVFVRRSVSGPFKNPASLVEHVQVEAGLVEGGFDSHIQNRLAGDLPTAGAIQKAQVLVQQEVGVLHHFVRLRNQHVRGKMRAVLVHKGSVLVVRHGQHRRVSKVSVVGTGVFPFQDQDLEDFPAHGIQFPNLFRHVLVAVVPANDRVDFKLDAVVAAPLSHPEHPPNVLVVGIATPPDLGVRAWIERIHRDPQNVHVVPELVHPFLGDERPVRNNRYGHAHFVGLLAQLTQQIGPNKWFASREIDFFGSGVFQELQSPGGLLYR